MHFAIALAVMAAASYVLVRLPVTRRWRDSLQPAGDWMLAFAAIAVIATVAAGLQANYSVAHDTPSHASMTTHRNWAAPTAVAILALALWRWRRRAAAPSLFFTFAFVAAIALLTVTAWWGGRLVYGHGLGVAQLPQPEDAGHTHQHLAGEEHAPSQAVRPSAPNTPEGMADAFAAALRAGDESAVRRVMADEVIIAESGGVEQSFAEYAGHRMPADMAFSATVRFTLEDRDVIMSEDAATVRFDAASDVTLSELRIELMYPGNDAAEARSSFRWTAVLVFAWVAFAAMLGVSSYFSEWLALPGVRIGVGAAIALAFAIALTRVPRAARVLHAVPQSWLVGVQAYRGLGSIFLVLYGLGQMPGAFALPAGFGDVAIALLAIPLALLYEARWKQREAALVIWNIAGILDLVLAATMGVLTTPAFNLIEANPPNTLLAEWPLILAPLFAVPLSILLHVASLTKLSWDRELEAREAAAAPL